MTASEASRWKPTRGEGREHVTAPDVAGWAGIHPESARSALANLERGGHITRVYEAPALGSGGGRPPEDGYWDGYTPAAENAVEGESSIDAFRRLPDIGQPTGNERLVYLAAVESNRRSDRGNHTPFAAATEVAALTGLGSDEVRDALDNLVSEGHLRAPEEAESSHRLFDDMYLLT